MNRELEFPVLPKNIALISSQDAAGYQDFMEQITQNPEGYRFHIKLFDAVMQGDSAPASIMMALNRIFEHVGLFDVVVIIRGGGAVLDLTCFNDYELAFFTAQFPLPVITGIGHDKDETILDIIAHTKLKTPTAVAGYLLDCFSFADSEIDRMSINISERITEILDFHNDRLEKAIYDLKPLTERNHFKTNG